MNFSELQQKEMIDVKSGELLGFIEDAEIILETGKIEFFIVGAPKKFYQLFQGEKENIKVYIEDILSIGRDVIIVNKK